jgi:hypothetical protein
MAFFLRLVPQLSQQWRGATDDQIAEVEKIAGRPLPRFYRWFSSARAGGAMQATRSAATNTDPRKRNPRVPTRGPTIIRADDSAPRSAMAAIEVAACANLVAGKRRKALE